MSPAEKGPVGLIAGNLSLPVMAARKLKASGRELFVAGISGESDPELQSLSDAYAEIPLGSLAPLADFFLSRGCGTVAMAGGITRENIINNYNPDGEAVRIMEALPNFHTDTILRAFGLWLENRGLRLVGIADLVPEILVRPGYLGKHRPSPELLEDLALAFKYARELGRLDIGQTVVVSDKIAVALEGADGTDATIRRGASLCLKPVAVAKVLKPVQDARLDLPVVGPSTLELLREVGAGGLALDASGLILLEEEACARMADEAGIVLVAWKDPPELFRKGAPPAKGEPRGDPQGESQGEPRGGEGPEDKSKKESPCPPGPGGS